jgi:hypothetical protein
MSQLFLIIEDLRQIQLRVLVHQKRYNGCRNDS